MLSTYARKEWLSILAVGVMLLVSAILLQWWWAVVLVVLLTAALLLFFRDPKRSIPATKHAIVAPADGKVSSVHDLDHFPPFDGPAVCVRIFLSVFDVHINRAPCHGQIQSVTHRDGLHRNALNPQSAEDNENTLIIMTHPVKGHPVAAVRQVSGLLARTIHTAVEPGDVVQRGERIGIIKLGSTTELYLPKDLNPRILVRPKESVKAGQSILAQVVPPSAEEAGAVLVTPSA